MKMTRVEYLADRGWTFRESDGSEYPWCDDFGAYGIAEAVDRQLARDAVEMRECVARAIAAAAACHCDRQTGAIDCVDRAGELAFSSYSTRFSVEFTDVSNVIDLGPTHDCGRLPDGLHVEVVMGAWFIRHVLGMDAKIKACPFCAEVLDHA